MQYFVSIYHISPRGIIISEWQSMTTAGKITCKSKQQSLTQSACSRNKTASATEHLLQCLLSRFCHLLHAHSNVFRSICTVWISDPPFTYEAEVQIDAQMHSHLVVCICVCAFVGECVQTQIPCRFQCSPLAYLDAHSNPASYWRRENGMPAETQRPDQCARSIHSILSLTFLFTGKTLHSSPFHTHSRDCISTTLKMKIPYLIWNVKLQKFIPHSNDSVSQYLCPTEAVCDSATPLLKYYPHDRKQQQIWAQCSSYEMQQ